MNNSEGLKFICIVDSFPPAEKQVSIRTLEFSKRLVKNNIFPIILTQKIGRNTFLNNSLINEIPYSLNIHRNLFRQLKNRYSRFLRDCLFKFYYFLGSIPFLNYRVQKILKKNKNVKFIYTSVPEFYIHIVGFLLKKRFHLPLVVEYRDPWSFNPYNGKKFREIIDKINLRIERKILNSADVIITISPALKMFLNTYFPFIKKKPIITIPHGLNLRKNDTFYEKKPKEIIFSFTGTLYEKRDITPLLEIISELKKEHIFNNIQFQLKIYGKYPKKSLKKVIQKLNISDLIFLGGFISRTEVINEIMKSDLAIHVGENLNYPTIAFKVWDYLSCRKKILYLGRKDSYTAQFLKKNKFGIVIPGNDLNKGKILLKNLLNDIKNKNFKSDVEDHLLNKFSWDNRVNKFINKVIKRI